MRMPALLNRASLVRTVEQREKAGGTRIRFLLHEGRSDCGGMPLQRYKTGDPGGHAAVTALDLLRKNDHQIWTVDRVQA